MAAMIRLFNARGFTVDRSPLLDELAVELTDVRTFLANSVWARRHVAPGVNGSDAR